MFGEFIIEVVCSEHGHVYEGDGLYEVARLVTEHTNHGTVDLAVDFLSSVS